MNEPEPAAHELRNDVARQPVRAGTHTDAEAIVRMRSAHILSAPLSEDWIRRCTRELAARLVPAGDARAFVIDGPDGVLAACALGLLHPVLSAPGYPRGMAARVQMVATHPDFRRHGYARAVLTALLNDLAGRHVTLFELHASEEAISLYRDLGFAPSPALMRMTRKEAPAEIAAAHANPTRMPLDQYVATVPKLTAFAAVYLTDEDDNPLHLRAVYATDHPWQMPGGTTDPGERPWETGTRVPRRDRLRPGRTAQAPSQRVRAARRWLTLPHHGLHLRRRTPHPQPDPRHHARPR